MSIPALSAEAAYRSESQALIVELRDKSGYPKVLATIITQYTLSEKETEIRIKIIPELTELNKLINKRKRISRDLKSVIGLNGWRPCGFGGFLTNFFIVKPLSNQQTENDAEIASHSREMKTLLKRYRKAPLPSPQILAQANEIKKRIQQTSN